MDDSKLRAVPEGWKLVPIEPTSEMVDSTNTVVHPYAAKLIYERMIDHAPAPIPAADHQEMGSYAAMSDERIAAIYKKTFESQPGCARSAPTCPPLVVHFARAILAAATSQPAAEQDKVDALVAAAESVIACVVGDLPTKGWLHDTDMSRKALSNLRAAILAKKEGAQ